MKYAISSLNIHKCFSLNIVTVSSHLPIRTATTKASNEARLIATFVSHCFSELKNILDAFIVWRSPDHFKLTYPNSLSYYKDPENYKSNASNTQTRDIYCYNNLGPFRPIISDHCFFKSFSEDLWNFCLTRKWPSEIPDLQNLKALLL